MGALLLVISPTVAEATSLMPPPVSQATTPSPLMIEPPAGNPNALANGIGVGGSGLATPAGFPVEGKEGPMPFNIGYVQHRPYVHVIFWGSEWSSYSGTREKILDLYRSLSGSSYANILTQYFDHGGYISNATDLTSFTDTRISHPSAVGGEALQTEINWAIGNQPGWASVNYENQYVVVTPPGTSSELCGYHAWSGSYSFTYVPWSPSFCRRGLEPWAAMQVTASHEWAESATDPIPVNEYWGWSLTDIQGEIADLCNDGTPAEHAEMAPGIWVAKLADDYLWSANGTPCVAHDAAPVRFQAATGASEVGVRRATLRGTLNPAGWAGYYQFAITGPEGTSYIPVRFENWPEKHYGFASIGNGFAAVPVSAQIANLHPGTTYSVRLEAAGALTNPGVFSELGHGKIFDGGQSTFTTPVWTPAISGESVTGRSTNSATVNAQIRPEESSTRFHIEWGMTTAYGTSTPIIDEPIGSGSSFVPVSVPLGGLKPETTYHYRVVATNSEGTAYGSDHSFTSAAVPPSFLASFGSEGTGNGQFKRPMGTAVDAAGNVYVVDREGNRVQKFNSKGEYLSQFGSTGTGNGQFKEPRSVTVAPDGTLWVTDGGNSRVEQFSAAGAYMQTLGGSGEVGGNKLQAPYGIAVDNQGRVWISDANKVVEFKESTPGAYAYYGVLTTTDGSAMNLPAGISLDAAGDVWVAETGANRITEIEKTPVEGGFSFIPHIRFGTTGSGTGQLSSPYDVDVRPSGYLLVVDRGNNRVQQFSPGGEYMASFGTSGSGAGQFNEPSGVAVAAGGLIYVTDSGNKRVQCWSYE
jgi:DNA-binding beta-propeller fold protein YncE